MNIVGTYSLLFLNLIAVERYRKVCQRVRVQFSQRTTRVLCGLNFIVMLIVFIIPGFMIFGVNQQTTKTHSLPGYKCSVLNQLKKSMFVRVYGGFMLLTFVTSITISIVSYILIGRRIYIHQKNNITTPARDPDMKRDNSVASKSDKVGQSTEKEKAFLKSMHERKRKKLVKSRNVTKVFLVVSVISFGVYLPYLLTTVIRNINPRLYQNFVDNNGSLSYFIIWMIFLNNAINPIVYGFMDRKFRQELSAFYIQMKRCLVSWRHG
ncbi:orexin receptor type 2-like [Ylistrum balloti]|uniref:orexin receptor type 2-like n=1 Tax=Ylistrum balloti TaxID=509963 RepID=UPI002905A01C|nr:orexin receptor type 2-like [Ylistrum balloti]